jgi:hypothetical protein
MKSGDLTQPDHLEPSPNGGATSVSQVTEHKRRVPANLLLFGGLALGVLVGLTMTSLWLVRRQQEEEVPPLRRAERLIDSCEEKIQEIQKALESLTDT